MANGHRLHLSFLFSVLLLAITACGGPREVVVDITATMDGAPVTDAVVIIDAKEVGKTNASGKFNTMIIRDYNSDISILVDKKIDGHKVTPWKHEYKFTEDMEDEFAFTAPLSSAPYVAVQAKDGKTPIKEAKVYLNGEKVGVTDENGQFDVVFAKAGEQLKLRIKKDGYGRWDKTVKSAKAGESVTANMIQRLHISLKTVTDFIGKDKALKNLTITLDGKNIGKTNNNGSFTYVKNGNKGKKGTLKILADGYLPAVYSKTINLSGSTKLKRYFYTAKAEKVRMSFFTFSSNSAGEDIGNIPLRFQAAIEDRVKKADGFELVGSDVLMNDIKQHKVEIEKLTSKGWLKSPLYKIVDVIGFGSVSKNLQGNYIAEVKFYDSDGKLVSSQITNARNPDKLDRAAKQLVINLSETFPFVGRVVKVDGNDAYLSLGGDKFSLSRGDEFTVLNPNMDKNGKIKDYMEVGGLKLSRTGDDNARTEVDFIKKGQAVAVAAKVIRRAFRADSGDEFVTIKTKGSMGANISDLSGVNVYLDEKWMGVTDNEGKVKIPLRLGKDYDLSLYKHGYKQIMTEDFEVAKNHESKEFTLESYNSMMRVATNPSGASVFVDGTNVGNTPIADGVSVTTGFHTVRISKGGDYRDFNEVVEFIGEDVNYDIELPKDWLRLGDSAESRGDFDKALQLYGNADDKHPDYGEAHHRMAQIYLDQKKDPDSAIAEFEKMMSVPEIKQLIYKQFAVAYTNMGHAYHAKANKVLHSDKKSAATFLAKSLKSLDVAKKNARFFPNDSYDEVVHDTYYYTALTYHKLYQLSKNDKLRRDAKRAWTDYMDFFPESLETKGNYSEIKDGAERFIEQLGG